MLYVDCEAGDKIEIDREVVERDAITIHVKKKSGRRVRLGIEAGKHIPIRHTKNGERVR